VPAGATTILIVTLDVCSGSSILAITFSS